MVHRIASRFAAIGAISSAGAALAVTCYTTIDVGPACVYVSCPVTGACSGPTVIEDIYTTTSAGENDGDRKSRAEDDAVCHKEWLTTDPATGHCSVPQTCEKVVNGWRAHGALCPGDGGIE